MIILLYLFLDVVRCTAATPETAMTPIDISQSLMIVVEQHSFIVAGILVIVTCIVLFIGTMIVSCCGRPTEYEYSVLPQSDIYKDCIITPSQLLNNGDIKHCRNQDYAIGSKTNHLVISVGDSGFITSNIKTCENQNKIHKEIFKKSAVRCKTLENKSSRKCETIAHSRKVCNNVICSECAMLSSEYTVLCSGHEIKLTNENACKKCLSFDDRGLTLTNDNDCDEVKRQSY